MTANEADEMAVLYEVVKETLRYAVVAIESGKVLFEDVKAMSEVINNLENILDIEFIYTRDHDIDPYVAINQRIDDLREIVNKGTM